MVAVAEEVVVAVDNASSVGTIEGVAAESMTVLVLLARGSGRRGDCRALCNLLLRRGVAFGKFRIADPCVLGEPLVRDAAERTVTVRPSVSVATEAGGQRGSTDLLGGGCRHAGDCGSRQGTVKSG